MRKRTAAYVIVSALMLSAFAGSSIAGQNGTTEVMSDPGTPDVGTIDDTRSSYFIENRGQWDPRIRFLARTDLGSVAFGDGCVYYNVIDKEAVSAGDGTNKDRSAIFSEGRPEGSIEGTVIRLEFEGAGPTIPRGDGLIDRCSNYFLGDDPSRWAAGVPSYDSVIYHDVWCGIDVIWFAKVSELPAIKNTVPPG